MDLTVPSPLGLLVAVAVHRGFLSKNLNINTLYLGRPAGAHVPPLSFPLRRSEDGP